MPQADKDYLAGISRQGSGVVAQLVAALDPLRAAFAAHKDDVARALYAAPDFAAVLDAVDSMGSGAGAGGGGSGVPPAEAAFTGTLLRVDPFGGIFDITLAEALTSHVANGNPFVIAGAGAPLADLLEEIPAWRGQIGLDGLIVQYVGIDRQHWSPDKAVTLLELNLLQAAAAQALNSAMNEAGLKAVVISHGFGCWVANRALLGLPLRKVWFARNLQLDPLGSPAVMADLISAKDGGYGAITNVQGKVARAALSEEFEVPHEMLKSMPVDITA